MRHGEIDRDTLARTPVTVASLALTAALVTAVAFGCGSNETPPQADGGVPDDGTGSIAVEAGIEGDAGTSNDADAAITLSAMQIDFSTVPCGTAASTSTLVVGNATAAPVALSATTNGAGFAVGPALLRLAAGASGTLTLTASVPTSAVAGLAIVGSLALATDVPRNAPITLPLSVTPSGASLAFAPGEPTTFAFPLTEVGYPAELPLSLVNVGNAPATFTLGPPSDPRFSLAGDAGALLAPGDTLRVAADFTATGTMPVYATSVVSTTGVTCASSLRSLTYSGSGTTGQITGWPASVDFGPADCGGVAPVARTFTLMNGGAADAHVMQVALTGSPGFTTTAQAGRAIFGHGGSLEIKVGAPAVPTPSASAPVTATLTIQTDAEASPHAITLTEEPNGAILAFDTSGSPAFGQFGQVPVLGSASQGFSVANTGSTPAHVTLTASPTSTFSLSTPAFAIGGNGSQTEIVTFAPTSGGSATGSIAMTATGALCGPLPAPIPLSGTSGAMPGVSPTSLSFGAVCGGGAPAGEVFFVTNGGNGNMTWSMSDRTGPGAGLYSLTANPPPGTLIPGAKAFVVVTAAAMPSPPPSTDPSAFAAQVVITTDVPFDPPHVVTFGEAPLGAQLSFATSSPLRFGQVPIGTALSQAFTVVNGGNAGSAPATLTFSVEGAGAAAYTVTPPGGVNVIANGGVTSGERITFTPAATGPYPAKVTIVTADPLCIPLPPPLELGGSGM